MSLIIIKRDLVIPTLCATAAGIALVALGSRIMVPTHYLKNLNNKKKSCKAAKSVEVKSSEEVKKQDENEDWNCRVSHFMMYSMMALGAAVVNASSKPHLARRVLPTDPVSSLTAWPEGVNVPISFYTPLP